MPIEILINKIIKDFRDNLTHHFYILINKNEIIYFHLFVFPKKKVRATTLDKI